MPDVADSPGADHLQHLLGNREEAGPGSLHEENIVLLCACSHFTELSSIDRGRLLAEHTLSMFHRHDGKFLMLRVRNRNVDDIDFRVPAHLLIGFDLRQIPAVRDLPGRCLCSRRYRGDLTVIALKQAHHPTVNNRACPEKSPSYFLPHKCTSCSFLLHTASDIRFRMRIPRPSQNSKFRHPSGKNFSRL